ALPAAIAIGAASGPLALNFDVAVSAHAPAAQPVGAASISGALGQVQVRGAMLPAVVYERVPWPEIGATLYQALAVGDGEWWLLWFYCAGGSLHTTYYESTHGGGAQLAPYLVGTCTEVARTQSVQVELPPSRIQLGALAGGYRVDGPDLTIDCDGTGRV